MEIAYAIISIFAIIIGPILAVKAQSAVDRKREKHDRKLNIYRILMATRSAALSPEHVRALNMIDIEFYDENAVLDAWRDYHDNLGTAYTEDTFHVWVENNNKLLVNLLKEMSAVLGYKFDNVTLKKGGYLPAGHGKLDMENQEIRDRILKILRGEIPFPVTNIVLDEDLDKFSKEFRALLGAVITGKSPIKIEISNTELLKFV